MEFGGLICIRLTSRIVSIEPELEGPAFGWLF